jgi:Flp pilus assembly protein TadD
LRAALQIDATDFTALFNLGDLALKANEPEKAVSLLEAAVKHRPGDVDAHQQLATAYALSGRVSDAVVQLREAIRLSHEVSLILPTPIIQPDNACLILAPLPRPL